MDSLLHPSNEVTTEQLLERISALESSDNRHALRGGSAVTYGADGRILNITADAINAGTINASVVAVTNLNASNITTGSINASTISITHIDADNISTGTLSANRIASNSISASKLDVATLSAISANIGTITSGSITGVTVSSSGGNDRIVLDTGDYIRFYLGNTLRGSLRGASASGATGIIADCDLVIANNRSFMMKSSGGGATEYSGLGLATNDMWLTLGTANKLYIKNNAQNYNYFTISSTQLYSGVGHEFGDWTQFDGDLNINNNMLYNIEYLEFNTKGNTTTDGRIWYHDDGGGARSWRSRNTTWNGQFDQTGF